jgi:hypothetical protein
VKLGITSSKRELLEALVVGLKVKNEDFLVFLTIECPAFKTEIFRPVDVA